MKNRRASYWIVDNESFGIRNLKVCNLAEFLRKINEFSNVRGLIQVARKNGNSSIQISSGWVIAWSFNDPFQEIFKIKQIPPPLPSLVKPNKIRKYQHWTETRFKGRVCIN